MKLKKLHSVRKRYGVAAAVLALAVVLFAGIAHYDVTARGAETTRNIEVRNQLLVQSRHVRDALWQARQTLAAFLLDPQGGRQRELIDADLDRGTIGVDTLQKESTGYLRTQSESLAELQLTISDLRSAITNVMSTRLNSAEQYPSMALAQRDLLPAQRDFYTAVALAMVEIESEGGNVSHARVYQTLVQARHLWTQMISNFRMYIANRMGSFAESSLGLQEQDVETIFQGLEQQLELLRQLQKEGNVGLQTEDSLQQMNLLAARWIKLFSQVKQLHASDAWRADTKLMKESVEPLFLKIWEYLLQIDKAIEQNADRDVQTLSRAAQEQTRTLWIVTGIGLLFILLGYFGLERSVLRPLSRVSQALNAEAQGGEVVALPAATSEETKNLLDAFDAMRKQVHSRQLVLEHQALHDSLTGLPNRTLLVDRLQHTIFTAKRKSEKLALMMLDLDRFKEVNDTLGHQVGDRLLTKVGALLMDALRETDTIARLGGDEFCILLPETDTEHAQQIAGRILQSMEGAIEIDGQQLLVGVSIGIANYPEHGDTPHALLQRADVAMYVAKRNKTGQATYSADDDQHSMRRLGLIHDLREALSRNELELHYQPKIDVKSGAVAGVEALLRWNHPVHGRIPPDQVIPLAEQTGLIRPLTRWVLDLALQQCTAWKRDGIDMQVAVNLSAFCLQDNELGDWIKAWFDSHELPVRHLLLEVTESAMMSDPKKAVQVLSQLDQMGIHISVDDYGTGFSSLAYLKQLPIDELKIDKSFVLDMLNNENDAVIVRSTIDLAHNLGLRIVAEGVESKAMLDLLAALGCDYAQGYFISHPIPPHELAIWLRARTRQANADSAVLETA